MYPSPHPHSGAVAQAQNAWFEAIANTCCPFPHSATGRTFIYIWINLWLLWADSNEHLKEKEESPNQYSKLDTTHSPTLRHSWSSAVGLKWFDKNSVTCKRKGKLLGFSKNISHFPRQPWKSREKDFSPVFKFFKYIHSAKQQWMGCWRHTWEVFLALC